MNASDIQATSTSPPPPAPGPPQGDHGFSFHSLLSALNPLQYLPIVGTIYRAITGDVIPDAVRIPGSMVASGLLGGPIGLVSCIALLIGEKATGIDPEKLVTGLFHNAPPTAAAATATDTTEPTTVVVAEAPSPGTGRLAWSPGMARLAWSPQQLAAYGVSLDASGTMHRGDADAADVRNEIELARIGRATSAYAAVTLVAQG